MSRAAWQPPQRLKRPLRTLFGALGYELVRLRRPATRFTTDLLATQRIDLVLDVGANQGQYAQRMRALGYTGRIVSFEPGSEAFRLLSTHARDDALWSVRQCALGAQQGTGSLAVSEDSVSSSLLNVAEPHLRAAPRSSAIKHEDVRVDTLDALVMPVDDARIWLKVDTQGSEDQVLAGAVATLERARVLQAEVSLVECYVGQADYRAVFDIAHRSGLRLVSIEPGTQDPVTGTPLQIDAIFARPSLEGPASR